MKKLMIALFLLTGTAMTKEAGAQVNISINIGSQPAWGPTGYDYAGFYYLPEINCYYDIGRAQFIYPNGSNWVYARALPSRYRGVNLYNTYKVVIDQPTPYRYNRTHIQQYGRYKAVHNQPVIRDSRDRKYFASKQHPQHGQWEKEQRGHQGNNGQGNGPDRGPRGKAKGHDR